MNRNATSSTHGLVGQSPEIGSVRRLIDKAARNRLPVLLLGETGTGKEVVARALHNANPRGQFVPIDCGSLVGTLMESELFGHVKGSFSGAAESKKGLIEVADGGTAFFDEIGDLPLEMQVKLLRLIQEREFRAVGSLQWRKVDLRIIAATHRDLKVEVDARRFRQDLFYRLNVFTIHLPPLRERKEDIRLLIDHFLDAGQPECESAVGRQASGPDSVHLPRERTNGFHLPRFYPSPEILDVLLSYDWPGNVRELKHCIDRMAALNSEGVLHMADLPSALVDHYRGLGLQQLSQAVGGQADDPDCGSCRLPYISIAPKSPVISIRESERQTISAALAATNGERAKAAKILKTSRTTLYRKMKEYGIE
ncbi:MAG: sigma-54 dependent transcriptional regulator [Acidobacteriia bacterium]|nr:sigma-54 dependent transcriptional regulator [Terriglobia bacterium]